MRRPWRWSLIAIAAGAALLPVEQARAADAVIATGLPAATRIDALDGHVVWSESDPAGKRWQLVEYSATGPVELPIAAAKAPFDVDLGRDRRGALVAVYSRCRNVEEFERHGCDLYRYGFTTRRETKLRKVSTERSDEYEPTLWGSRLAFARGHRLYIRDLRPGHRARRLHQARNAALPSEMDVRGRVAATQWDLEWSGAVGLATPRRPGRNLLLTPGSGAAAQVYSTVNPTFADAHTVYWGLASDDPGFGEIWRRDPRTRRNEHASIRIERELEAFAQDHDVSYYAVSTGDPGSPLELHRLDGLTFERAPRLTLDEEAAGS